jgi:phosphoribosylformimino-5-aminoimidazole carboxamide ribotide isomerase
MTLFKPCIDLHDGQVKQIVGGSLSDSGAGLRTNFVASQPPEYYATRYRQDRLEGGHVIKLGPGNDEAAKRALIGWPDGLHIGGGIDIDNAQGWIEAGANKVIVTSWLFPRGVYAAERLAALSNRLSRKRVVVDLSCRRRGDRWFVAINRWQTLTEFELTETSVVALSTHCSEFLIHAADVEGLCTGIDEELVAALGRWSPIPCVYAGGARSIDDLMLVDRLSKGRVDLTYGSALDLFGGTLVKYDDCVTWNRAQERHRRGNIR